MYYQAYQLTLDSEMELPELPVIAQPGAAAVYRVKAELWLQGSEIIDLQEDDQ